MQAVPLACSFFKPSKILPARGRRLGNEKIFMKKVILMKCKTKNEMLKSNIQSKL